MAVRTDTFDLGGLHLSAGEGRHLELGVAIGPFELGGERYEVTPASADSDAEALAGPARATLIPARIDVSRTIGGGYALRLRFEATLSGPCMRCLKDASPRFEVDAREVSQPGEGEELESPYVEGQVLELAAWARDALALALPAQLLCRPGCEGLCPVCGVDLNDAGPDHHHDAPPDPRWAKLSEIRFD